MTDLPLADLAQARLQASRARLRAALVPINPPGGHPPGGGHGTHGAVGARSGSDDSLWPTALRLLWRRGRHKLKAWPVADLAAGLVQDWWQRNPWRRPGEIMLQQARSALLPWVRRHPGLALLGAATLGAGLVASRPWRSRPAIPAKRPAAARPVRWLLRQLMQPATQTALLSMLLLLQKRGSVAEPGAPATAPAAAPAQSFAPMSCSNPSNPSNLSPERPSP